MRNSFSFGVCVESKLASDPYVAQDDLELQIFLLPPPKC